MEPATDTLYMDSMHKDNTTTDGTTPAHPRRQEWKKSTLFAACCMFLLLASENAYATNTPMGDVLCEIVAMVYGNLGRGLATLAVVIIGVGATLGKTSWGLAMTVAVGISVIFNAHVVVNYLGSGVGGCF